MRILVADDNPLSLAFFTEALSALGMTCTTAADGILAAEAAERDAFDLLLLDVRMPRLDGIAALARIRAGNGPSRATPALATTADDERGTHASLRSAGFAEVLVKPITIPALRQAIARHAEAESDKAADAPLLDDATALRACQTQATLAALRSLFAQELEQLPGEIARLAQAGDAAGLRDRLHRLKASTGFCGAPALAAAIGELGQRIDRDAAGLPVHCQRFLEVAARTRTQLLRPGS